MAPARNYARELEALTQRLKREGKVPSLLLHACCAPCSTAVLEQLARSFSVTVFYYNPNIFPAGEYEKRGEELRRLLASMPLERPVSFLDAGYRGEDFAAVSRGLEDLPEGGARCLACYRLRLEETARAAKAGGFDYFTTTLSVSPLKNAARLNQIGEEAGARLGVAHLPGDFKKKEGYKRSVALSREYGLYRQDYCGCVYSRREREKQKGGRDGHASDA